MKDFIEKRSLTGKINITCKYDDGTQRVWSTDKETVIGNIQTIIADYRRQGYVLTLRQLYYQLVSANAIINHDSCYKKLSAILDDCRYSGTVDWAAIEDRGRVPYIPFWVNNVAEGLDVIKNQYRVNRQQGQENYIELWTEKDALSGILKRVTSKYHIQLVVNKGYTSSSAIHVAYQRFAEAILNGQKVKLLYFGDHDPSGLDMVRDITDRLMLFLSSGCLLKDEDNEFYQTFKDWWEAEDSAGDQKSIYDLQEAGLMSDKAVDDFFNSENFDAANEIFLNAQMRYYIITCSLFEVVHVGLTMQQIKQYKLPPNPAKMTDARAANYVKEHGKMSWEVDALKPDVLVSLVEQHMLEHVDREQYDKMLELEQEGITELQELIDERQ